ncbi:tRNA (adenosine(37)-N6)-threonylcarbamoyltransferase complex dimerization subunit type 1 TsaB [Curtobacterium ammoniigenes]|uniref:tRNA (adenosine(37)-N6)-threonylcarbamoyltransferase complex dimerization subunit type 1 TsaB n=1 Tax=Curtobacterium ammoniigenes TaxID=395387 RepID=UPI00082D96FF|nr:tRNA (adenosine(37)-N6)-threonylcarbamoyltransferase complex dimerization subunit type 1 TsaB [Curtobacterium ammoniigenes]
MLLAIDTSAGTSVAVVDPVGPTVRALRATSDTRRHAEAIGPFIAEALVAAAVSSTDITAVVAGMGPGPFTGLRVGIVAARTFASARGIPLLPVVSHDAAAAQIVAAKAPDAVGASSSADEFVVLTDARRREQYWSAYRGGASGVFERVAGPGLAKPTDLDTALGPFAAAPRTLIDAIDAGWLGVLAAERLSSGAAFAPDSPLYLRDPDVTMPGAPKRVAS